MLYKEREAKIEEINKVGDAAGYSRGATFGEP